MAAIADEHLIPVENLLSPDLLRRLCWSPPDDLDDEVITETLRAGGARPWQVELTAHVIGCALRREAVRPRRCEPRPRPSLCPRSCARALG